MYKLGMAAGFGVKGGVDGGINNNGDRAQDRENVWFNDASYWLYFQRLLGMAISVFKWEGLPKGIDQRQLEMWLIQYGFVGFFHDEALKLASDSEAAPDGYAVLPLMLQGDWNIYNIPRNRRAYAVNGYQRQLDETDSVIIFNNYIRMPMMYIIQLYAERLARIDRAIDVNVSNQKTPKIIRCTPQQRNSFKNIMMQIDGNYYNIFADKNFDPASIEVLDVTAPFTGVEMQTLKHQLWNEALTYIGVENTNTDKKERLITDEVMSNMGDVETERFNRLDARKDACEVINERWGLDVSVDFKSGTYVSGGAFGNERHRVEGMQEGGMEGGAYE